MYKKIVVTGAAGFIGSHLAEHWLNKEHVEQVMGIDSLSIGSDLFNLPFDNSKFIFKHIDVNDDVLKVVLEQFEPDLILHLAANTHVDRSIQDARPFAFSNVQGTANLFECCKDLKNLKRFVTFGTDEVLGSKFSGESYENDVLSPRNPYAATKAAQELISQSYLITHGFPVIIIRCSNVFGPRQFSEKFLPTIIRSLILEEKIPLYGKGEQRREWTYVKEVCRALDIIVEKGTVGEIYHIGSGEERKNIDVVKMVLKVMNKDFDDCVEYVPDRLAHDFRYFLNTDKLQKLGWKYNGNMEEYFKETINWFIENLP